MAFGSVIWTWFNGSWHQGDLPVMNSADHGAWLGSAVFDGARSFEGVVPDIEAHCGRVNASAKAMGLNPTHSVEEMVALVHQGLAKFDADAAVYIRPSYWARDGGAFVIVPDPESTAFCLTLEQAPMATGETGQSLCRTRFTRPTTGRFATSCRRRLLGRPRPPDRGAGRPHPLRTGCRFGRRFGRPSGG